MAALWVTGRHHIITKSMRTLLLVNQLWFIAPINSWKNCKSSELLYKGNRPPVSMVYRLKITCDGGKTLEEFFSCSAKTSRVVYQPTKPYTLAVYCLSIILGFRD